jgi:hypothetical protein
VRFTDGKIVEAQIDHPKGHPNNMMTTTEFAAKTADCATFAARSLPVDTAARLIAAVEGLESLADIADLVSVMTGQP